MYFNNAILEKNQPLVKSVDKASKAPQMWGEGETRVAVGETRWWRIRDMGMCSLHNVRGVGCGVKKVWWRTVSARTDAEARLVRVMGEWLDGGRRWMYLLLRWFML